MAQDNYEDYVLDTIRRDRQEWEDLLRYGPKLPVGRDLAPPSWEALEAIQSSYPRRPAELPYPRQFQNPVSPIAAPYGRHAPIDDIIRVMQGANVLSGSGLRLFPRPRPRPQVSLSHLMRLGPQGAMNYLATLPPGPSPEEEQADLQDQLARTNYLLDREREERQYQREEQREERQYQRGKGAAIEKEREERENAGLSFADQWGPTIEKNLQVRDAQAAALASLRGIHKLIKEEAAKGTIRLTDKDKGEAKASPKDGIYAVNPYKNILPSASETELPGTGTNVGFGLSSLAAGPAAPYLRWLYGQKAEKREKERAAAKATTASQLSSALDERIEAFNEAMRQYEAAKLETADLEKRSRPLGYYVSPDGTALVDIKRRKSYKLPVSKAKPVESARQAGFTWDPTTGTLIPRK